MFEITQDLIERQLENERGQITGGIEKYRGQVETSKRKGKFGASRPGMWVIEHCLPKLRDRIQERIVEAQTVGAGRHNFVVKYLQHLKPEVAAYITLRVLVDATAKRETGKTRVSQRIGRAVQEELEHLSMRTQNKSAYEYWTQRAREATHPTTRKRRMEKLESITDRSAFKDIPHEDLVYIGVACLEDARSSSGIVSERLVRKKRVKTESHIELAPFFVEEIEKFNR